MTKSLTRMDIDGQAFQGEWGGVPKRERVMHAALFRLDSKGHWQPRNVVLTADRLIILARKQPVHREGLITHLGSTDSEHQQHVDAYICTCTCIGIGMSMCIRICTCVYMHMHEYMYMYKYVCICTCICICICVCVCVCVCVCLCLCVCACVCV